MPFVCIHAFPMVCGREEMVSNYTEPKLKKQGTSEKFISDRFLEEEVHILFIKFLGHLSH